MTFGVKSKVGLEHVAARVWASAKEQMWMELVTGLQQGWQKVAWVCGLRDDSSPDGLVRKVEEPWRRQHPRGSWKALPY